MPGRAVVVVLVLAVLPTAAAQSGSIDLVLGELPAIIKPEIESPTFAATATVSCDAVLQRVPPTAPQGPVLVQFAFSASESVLFSGPGSVYLDPAPCMAGAATATAQADFQVTVSRAAPGLQAIAATGQATLLSDSPLAEDLSSSPVPFAVAADYYSLNQVKLASKLQACIGPCNATFELEVVNFGNARTRYTFEIAAEPSLEGWSAVLPQPIVVDAAGQGPSSATVTVTVQAPKANDEGAYQVVIRPAAFDDPSKLGNPLTANMLLRVHPPETRIRGAEELEGLDAPAPVAPMMVMGLLGLAVVVRRRA